MKKSKSLNILYLCLVLFYLFIGIAVFIFADDKREKNNNILGVLILLSTLPHLVIFLTQGGFKNNRKYPFLAFTLIGVTIGLVAIFKKDISLDKVCIMWGCFDICRSTFEISDLIPDLKQHKWLELINFVLCVGEICIAILLIVEEFGGIRLHMYYFGTVFVVSAVKRILDNLTSNLKHEKSIDSN